MAESAIEQFKAIAAQERFKGWPIVGEPAKRYKLKDMIKYFGQVFSYVLRTPNGDEEYTSLLRHYGWAVVLGVTKEGNVITNIQWKSGINGVEWGLSPGGVGKVTGDMGMNEVLAKAKAMFRSETGYAGDTWINLGASNVESGKYRGASPDDHGLPAHMFLVVDLEYVCEPTPLPNEIMDKLHVPLGEFYREVLPATELDAKGFVRRLFNEISAVACAYAARPELEKLGYRF